MECLVCKIAFKKGDQKIKCNQCEESVHRRCFTSIDKDGYKIAKRDNSFKCFACELESIPSPVVEVNSIPPQQLRPKRNRKPNPRYDQSSPKRRSAAGIPFSDSVFASTSSSSNSIVNQTFTIHSSSDHSVSREEVVLASMPSSIMDLPDIPQELIDIAVANMSLNDSDAINSLDFSFSESNVLHSPSPVRMEDNSRASRSSVEAENEDPVRSSLRHVTPIPIRERSLINDEPITPAIRVKHFHIEFGASIRGKDQLLDGIGNRYGRKSEKPTKSGVVTWLCTRRGLKGEQSCSAFVKQKGGEFKEGEKGHSHLPDPSLILKVPLVKKVKENALSKKFESAKAIAEDALVPAAMQHPDLDLPHPDNLAKAGNYIRQKDRPLHPTTLQFELQQNALSKDFFVGDITVGDRRHILFASKEQLRDLQNMRRWYVDGTFHVAKLPFSQLFTIHGFVTKDGKSKQVPLLYVLMSGRELTDYVAVLEKLKSLFDPDYEPCLEEVVLDFETATKRAFEDVFPDVKIFGCNFHWTQTVYRNLKRLGFSVAYRTDSKIKELVGEVLALPFAPYQQIPGCLKKLKDRSIKLVADLIELNEERTDINLPPLPITDLRTFFDYVEKQWITSRVWSPETWSVFFQEVRTNNDAEGWHYRINMHAPKKGDLNLYHLIELLYKETQMNLINKRLLLQGKDVRSQNKVYVRTNEKIKGIWEKYQHTKEYTVDELLKYCSKTYRMPSEYDPSD